MFLSRYQEVCSHVPRRLSDEDVSLKAGRAAAVDEAGDEVCHFLRGLVLSMRKCVGKHIALAQPSVNKRS